MARRILSLTVVLVILFPACGEGTIDDAATGTTEGRGATTVATVPIEPPTSPHSSSPPETTLPPLECRPATLPHRGTTMAGTAETCEFESDGLTRSYLRYIPQNVVPGVAAPLLVSLHPAFQDPARQMSWFPFDELADEEGFIAVAPAAVDGFWNLDVAPEQYCDYMQVSFDCGMIDPTTEQPVEPPDPECTFDEDPDAPERPDDLAFLNDLVEAVARDYAIDLQRVYLAGGSWGGWMASLVACTPGQPFAAFAGMTNTMWHLTDCAASEPVPFISIGGSDDIYHPACMADVYAERWAQHNGCVLSPMEEVDETGVTKLEYSGCDADASVVTYHMPDLWLYPDMTVPSGFAPLRVIWEFFEAHPRR